MSNKALAFYLNGPLQAWGSSSRFQRRETELYPTKSGIVGLIAAAMGIDKHAEDEAELLKPIAAMSLSIYATESDSAGRLQRLSDYHTVGGGYDNKDPVQKLRITRKASGGASANAVITNRVYLTDARFVAVLEGESCIVKRCADALKNPVWGVWFGRKCCIPATPLLPTIGDTKQQACDDLLAELKLKFGGVELRQGQSEDEGDGAWFQSDYPLSFKERIFRARPVRRTEG